MMVILKFIFIHLDSFMIQGHQIQGHFQTSRCLEKKCTEQDKTQCTDQQTSHNHLRISKGLRSPNKYKILTFKVRLSQQHPCRLSIAFCLLGSAFCRLVTYCKYDPSRYIPSYFYFIDTNRASVTTAFKCFSFHTLWTYQCAKARFL